MNSKTGESPLSFIFNGNMANNIIHDNNDTGTYNMVSTEEFRITLNTGDIIGLALAYFGCFFQAWLMILWLY